MNQEPTLAARLQAMHDVGSDLLEAEPKKALALMQEYCQLAEEEGSILDTARSRLLLGRTLLMNAELPAALDVLQAAEAGYAEAGEAVGQAEALGVAGKVSLSLGRLDQAESSLRRALVLTAPLHTSAAQAIRATALNHLAGVQHAQGSAVEALASLQDALSIWTQQHQASGQVHCLSNIGNIQTWMGQYHEAIATFSEAYQVYQLHLQDPRSEAFILGNLGLVHHLNGNNELAIEVLHAASGAADASEDGVLRASVLLNLGTFCLKAGRTAEAARHLGQALELSRELGYRIGELSTLDSLGSLYERSGDLEAAREAHQAALEIALDIGDAQGETEARLHLGKLNAALGQTGEAREQLRRSLHLARESQSPKEEAEAHQALAALFREQGDFQRAFEHGERLLALERELFDAERDRQTRNLTMQFEVERARHDADVYRLRTQVEQEARQRAEALVQQRTSELARAQHEVVTRLAMAAEYRDDTTGEHTRRVGRSAARIAQALGWSADQAGILGIAARLHDVGKIGIPDTVLLKEGKLNAAEYTQMQTHTLIGARILSGGRSELLRLAEEIALTHHERWDGQGYPRGLKGEQIPLTGRIVAVADVFDALTQARPYKKAWSQAEALREIERQDGIFFDPQVVAAALEVLTTSETLPLPVFDGQDSLASLEDLPLAQEEATHVLSVFEQLLVERTRELEAARREAELAAEHMARMALTDSLTGLANRRAFEADLEQAILAAQARTEPSGAPLTVLSLDLDGLKQINDTLGHGGGDRFLQAFSDAIAAEFAEVGQAYRIGGDEFAIISPAAPEDQECVRLLNIALQRVWDAQFPEAGASLGLARFPEDAQTPGDLLRVSDRRMYQQKLGRRSRP